MNYQSGTSQSGDFLFSSLCYQESGQSCVKGLLNQYICKYICACAGTFVVWRRLGHDCRLYKAFAILFSPLTYTTCMRYGFPA